MRTVPNDKDVSQAIEKIFRSELATRVIYILLILVVVIITVLVFKFNNEMSRKNKFLLALLVGICSLMLMVIKTVDFIPIYIDYKNQSYTVVEQANVCIQDGSSGIIDFTNNVVVKNGIGEEIELKIRTDYKLSTDTEYSGTIVYLNNSKYLIWYDFGN